MENVVIVTFDEPSRAAQALRELQRLDESKAVDLRAAAVLQREEDGTWRIADETQDPTFVGTIAGGLIGALLGTLTGPLGLLLGGTAGLLAGEIIDVTEDQEDELILDAMISHVPPAAAALVAEVDEPVTETVDAVMEKLGGRVMRRPRSEVQTELWSAAEAIRKIGKDSRAIFRRLKREQAAARA
jgi:uncharacterized membrane protein